ncbi:MAG TPA: branched-chain amino acid ABC transporter substrate-binding protein [Acidimicrobiales bacterium]|nr:branched-chain amino acid ABC transporter substrate-binding protein [Acidimicrobiales bacterium]
MRAVVVLLAATMVLAACGDDSDDKADSTDTTGGGAATKTVNLAFVGPLTGPNANLGINIRDGMTVAVQEANEKGGDVKFAIKEFDTQGDPAQAPGQKDKYIPDESIIAVVGPTFSGETRAVLPDLDKAGLVMISASATNVTLPTDIPTKSFHRVIPDDGVQAQGIADYVTSKLKPKKIALVHDNTDYGKGLWEGVVKLLTEAGIDTSTTDAIDPKSQDYSVAVNKVKAAKVDMVFYGGYYNEAGRFKKQLADADVDATFISGDGSLDPGFVVSSGAAGGEGALLTCPCRLATPDIAGAPGAFAKKYKQVVNKEPGTYSSEGYDAANILIQGVNEGNDTRAKLLAYVEGLDSFDGISKTIQFEDNGNVKAGDVFVYEVKGGKITELGKTSELTSS